MGPFREGSQKWEAAGLLSQLPETQKRKKEKKKKTGFQFKSLQAGCTLMVCKSVAVTRDELPWRGLPAAGCPHQ